MPVYACERASSPALPLVTPGDVAMLLEPRDCRLANPESELLVEGREPDRDTETPAGNQVNTGGQSNTELPWQQRTF